MASNGMNHFLRGAVVTLKGEELKIGLHYREDGDVMVLVGLARPNPMTEISHEYRIVVTDDDYFMGALQHSNTAYKTRHTDDIFRHGENTLKAAIWDSWMRFQNSTPAEDAEQRRRVRMAELENHLKSQGRSV